MDLLSEIFKKHGSGITIGLFVTPNAEINLFPVGVNKWRKRIEIKVNSEAKDNKANLEVVRLIAGFFKKPVKNVNIIKGMKSRDKTVLIENISEKKAFNKLKESLNGL